MNKFCSVIFLLVLYAFVAQWQRVRLLTERLVVRAHPGAFFLPFSLQRKYMRHMYDKIKRGILCFGLTGYCDLTKICGLNNVEGALFLPTIEWKILKDRLKFTFVK
jgi:hypothetical protein